MNNVKKFLVATFMFFSIGAIHSFEKPTNLGRYSEIIKAFDIDKKVFSPGFASQGGDIQSIELRKESLKKELEAKKITYATTWMPLLYKILGVGFGLESMRRLLFSGYIAADQAIGLSAEADRMVDYPFAALSYMNYPISKPIQKAEKFVQKNIFQIVPDSYKKEMYGVEGSFLVNDWDRFFLIRGIYTVASSFGISLGAGILAKYFFNKAASYKNEIDNIEKEIKIDDAMIDALSKKS